MVTVSVPGKVHLIGEHAVVYREPAILAAIGMRIAVGARKTDSVRVSDREMGPDLEWPVRECKEAAEKAQRLWEEGNKKKDFSGVFSLVKGSNFKKVAIGHVLNKLNIDSGISMGFSGNIPMGSGVGTSAALAVVIAKAVSEVYGKGLDNLQVNELAFDIEKFGHGLPSGGDNSVCCFGGLVWFKKGNPNTIESLKGEVPYNLENFVLVQTGKPVKTTGELVQQVRDLDPSVRESAVKAIGLATQEMRKALKEKDFGKMQALINLAQRNLKQLGVSTPEIDTLAEAVFKIGGAAKLCGAGGGGVVLCYHRDKEKLKNKIRELGFEPMEVELGVEGVRVEE